MKPSRADSETRDEIAATWLIRRDAGLSAAERAEFERWLAADPDHAAALAEMKAALATVARPRALGRVDAVMRDLSAWERQRGRRRHIVVFAAVTLAAAATIVFMMLPAVRERVAATAVAGNTPPLRPERRTLTDGSGIDLDANARIVVDFTPTVRRVRLLRGQAHFAVAKDAARPFVVTVGGIEVRAVGTEFAVRLATREIDVLVTEGQVAVAPVAAPGVATPPASDPVFVSAGARLAISAGNSPPAARIRQVTPAEIELALSWRGMRLDLSGTPLAEALALFNRRSRVQIALADPALAGIRISGIYWADNPDGFVRLLESSLGVRAVREAPDRIVLRSP